MACFVAIVLVQDVKGDMNHIMYIHAVRRMIIDLQYKSSSKCRGYMGSLIDAKLELGNHVKLVDAWFLKAVSFQERKLM